MLAIAGITLNSCEKQRLPGDGDWYPMEWNDVSGLSMVDNAYQVPASGGSYKFQMIGKISLDNGHMFSVWPMATWSLLSNHYHFTALLLNAR